MTRGRQANTAHVVPGKTAAAGHEPYQQAAPEAVLADILQREAEDLSATEQIRQAQDWTGGTGHLLNLWSAAVRGSLYPQIDEQIKARLSESEAWRYDRKHSRQVLQQQLRAAQLAGHDIGAVIDQITAAPMDGARSISSVLHGRLQRLKLPDLGHDVTWAQRTPESAPAVAHELAAGLDERARALGERLAVSPEPWLARQLGILAPHASPLLREEYARRAAAAAYREAAGITDPDQAIAPEPHRGNPELDDMRRTARRALEIRDEAETTRSMAQGELEARVLDGDRALASAPPDVSRELRLTAQAEADAWQQSADAEIRYDHAESDHAKTLARQMAARREHLEAVNAGYEKWAADTSAKRERAGKAKTELERRGLTRQAAGQERQAQPDGEPQTLAGWWRQFEADLAAVDRAIEQEHQAGLTAGQPWPPEHTLQPEPASEPEPAAGPPGAAEAGNWNEPPVSSPETASDYEPDGRAARVDELLAYVGEAARRSCGKRRTCSQGRLRGPGRAGSSGRARTRLAG